MANSLKVTLAGQGVIGDVEVGWSEQEFATPVNPNERAGGTGTVNFSARDVRNGVLAINKAVTSEYTPLGSVSGTVRSASQNGIKVGLGHDNKLAQYNAVKTMPPMIFASVPGALDLAQQILGDPGFTTPAVGPQNSGGAYWSLFGHAYGVDVSGNAVQSSMEVLPYQIYDPATAKYSSLSKNIYRNTLSAHAFRNVSNVCHAGVVTGDYFLLQQAQGSFAGTDHSSTKFIVMGKSIFDTSVPLIFSIDGEPSGPADGDYYVPISVQIDPVTENLTISAEYRSGGTRTTFTDVTSLASLDLTQEIAFRIYISASPPSSIPSYPLVIKASVVNTSDYTTVVTGTLNATPDLMPLWFYPWEITGNVRAIWKRDDLVSTSDISGWPVSEQQDWETARNYAWSGTLPQGEPAIGFTGTVWEWLQHACAAYRWEVCLSANVVTTRPIGSVALNVDNYAASANVTPSTTRTGRQVDVTYHNVTVKSNGEIYDAREDDNRIISVGAAQETVTKIQSNAYLTSILQPTRTTTFVPGQGTYYIIDSTGLPIVENQWEDFGGALSVAIDNSEAGTIVVTFTGPREQIPSTTAPYSLAVSDGANQYAALSILGSGVVADTKTLNLLTGANPDITPQQVAFSVNQPFINRLGQAYDSGIWATVDASGPRVELSMSVPVNALTGFGVTAGSLITLRNSTFRVTSATVGAAQANISATRHVTVGTFDSVWAGQTVGDHDTAWANYLCEDQKVLSYLNAP